MTGFLAVNRIRLLWKSRIADLLGKFTRPSALPISDGVALSLFGRWGPFNHSL
jgi:hypothetical protein